MGSELVLDGDHTTCSSTELDISSWWSIDLQKSTLVTLIVLEGELLWYKFTHYVEDCREQLIKWEQQHCIQLVDSP